MTRILSEQIRIQLFGQVTHFAGVRYFGETHVAEFEPPLEAARTRAERLRLLAKFTAGDEKQMLLQANHAIITTTTNVIE
jgi:hypothetical protein